MSTQRTFGNLRRNSSGGSAASPGPSNRSCFVGDAGITYITFNRRSDRTVIT